tara:strand:- start:8 stop:583 length:576 start_codon:yes stop_codon:yes gene_type:complete
MTSTFEIWDNRYKNNGNSGNGSYGLLAEFKAEIINNFIYENNIHDIIELGCGDGNQCSLFKIEHYLGLDISPAIINYCKNKFKNNSKYNFEIYNNDYLNNKKYELSLSLDVIYHILDDNEYKKYMKDLFNFSNKYVIIYSNNYKGHKVGHMYTKNFTKDIEKWFNNYKIKQIIKQKYPQQSSADFYIYEKQ